MNKDNPDIGIQQPNGDRRNFLVGMAGASTAAILGITPQVSAAAAGSTQNKVNSYIRGLRRKGVIESDERTAWSVYDFDTGKKVVSINEEKSLQSASMIKPFVIQAYFYKHSENPSRYPLDSKTLDIMEAMIRYSSNRATNYLIRRVSKKPQGVERILKRYAGSIFQSTSIVETIPKNGRSYLNKASARDYSRFLYAMWNNKLPNSGQLRELMGIPNKDRIFHGTSEIPAQTRVYDKTGSTARLCGNMGILEPLGRNGKRYPYTFIGIIEKSHRTKHYSRWVASRGNVIREVSDIVYRDMKSIHRLA